MSSPVLAIAEGMKAKKHSKTKIGVGSVVKANVGEMENIAREVISIRIMKEVVVCVHAVLGKKSFLFQFEYENNKDISSSSIMFLSSKYEVEMDKPLSHYPEK